MSKAYLTDAGSILTVESRHSAYIRQSLAESPFPSAFDVPLDFNEVYTLAAPFIVACPPSNPPLPVKAFPTLSLATSTSTNISTGSTITIDAATPIDSTGKELYGAFITVTGPVFVPVTIAGDGSSFSLSVPAGIKGQSYVVLNCGDSSVSDDTVIAGPAIVEVM